MTDRTVFQSISRINLVTVPLQLAVFQAVAIMPRAQRQ